MKTNYLTLHPDRLDLPLAPCACGRLSSSVIIVGGEIPDDIEGVAVDVEYMDGGEKKHYTVAGTDDVVVYARWSASECVVTFDGNGGTPSEASRTYLTGFAYGSLPSAARSGRTFAGWWTESAGGTRVTAATAASAGTLYAHWSERQSVTGIF